MPVGVGVVAVRFAISVVAVALTFAAHGPLQWTAAILALCAPLQAEAC